MRTLALLALAACTTPVASPPPRADPEPTGPVDFDDCYAPDCPYVGALVFPMRDDDLAHSMLGVAVSGAYVFRYHTYGATRSSTEVSGAFTSDVDDGAGTATVRAAAPGTGRFFAAGYAPFHEIEVFGHDQIDLPALPVAAARIELPRYRSLDGGPIAPVFVGAAFTFAVHLVADDGRRLADTTLTASGAEPTPTRWNQFGTPTLAPGHHEIRIGADSIAPTTLAFDTIEYVDEIRTTDVREPYPSYYHVVCAHAFASGAEVFTEWTMTASGATGWIPAASGNCLEVVPGDRVAMLSFTAADGSAVQLAVRE
jgi:hypothetical protein